MFSLLALKKSTSATNIDWLLQRSTLYVVMKLPYFTSSCPINRINVVMLSSIKVGKIRRNGNINLN